MSIEDHALQLQLHLYQKFKSLSNVEIESVVKELEMLAKNGNLVAHKIVSEYDPNQDVSVSGSGIFSALDKEMLNIRGNGTKDTERTIMWGMWNKSNAKKDK